ncbi:MAG: ATP12 family protein [Kiloniellales bacterium]
MTRGKFKRFYKTVAVADAGPTGGFSVTLDGRTIKTPAQVDMILANRGLAAAVAAEWDEQGEDVEPAAMPLTGLVWSAIDVVRPNRARVIEDVSAFAAHDLVCYRAEGPADLTARQQAHWQPLIEWAARAFDAPLKVTSGVLPVAQPEGSLAALRRAVEAKGDFELTALGGAVTAAGSLVIGLALSAGEVDAETAFAAAQLDEGYQIERWGDDPEATRRRDTIKNDLGAAARFMDLLKG